MKELEIEVNGDKIELDAICMHCKGEGKIAKEESAVGHVPCFLCRGNGYILAPAGEAILELMLRYK